MSVTRNIVRVTRIVARNKKAVERAMSIPIAQEARTMLEVLTIASHRGPRDTWTAARDRTAKDLGLAPSYAARLWHRWESMKDVSGEAYRALKAAYDAQCDHNEHMAALHRQRAEEKRHGRSSHQDGTSETSSMD